MSYRCGSCGKAISKGKPQYKMVTQTRQAQYSNGGVGIETVTENAVCPDCRATMPQATVVPGITKVDTPRPALKKDDQRKSRY
jgi:DNA-directed RNA polymerase subunit RPC12/RpoP